MGLWFGPDRGYHVGYCACGYWAQFSIAGGQRDGVRGKVIEYGKDGENVSDA